MLNRVCYWTTANGDYFFQACALIKSFRSVGMTEDFVFIGETPIKGAKFIRAAIPRNELWGCWFKFRFLARYLAKLDYDVYVWLDCDNLFVRKPRGILDQIGNAPIHAFLECDLSDSRNSRTDWWGCPNSRIIELFRARGVAAHAIYNVNGGFFAIRRALINTFVRVADEFFEYCNCRGFRFVDEVPLAYAVHLFNPDYKRHTLQMSSDIWGVDWTGYYKDRLPDGAPWPSEHYMLGQRTIVNPAIVHAMRSKEALIQLGKECL